MPPRLIEVLASTPQYNSLFSDESLVQAMLDFECALAQAQAAEKVIPPTAADQIAKAAKAWDLDCEYLGSQSLRAGTVSIPLVKALTDKVRACDEQSARFVHWGATSQDISDTALVLLLRRAKDLLKKDHQKLQAALRRLSDRHAASVMLGRTLLQPAPPVTFGLKAAGWFAAVARGWSRLDQAFQQAFVLELGGASGTLAALGERGFSVAARMAKQLDLNLPEAPWHTHRDRLAGVICACGIYVGSLGKIARDLSLLAQNEVDEAREPQSEGRGGSSTMPQKQNPIGCALALAAAHRVPGLVSSFLTAMVQEHERALGGWHAESATIARIIEDTGLALTSMAEVAAGLTVRKDQMQSNLEATHGLIFAERAMMLLGPTLGRDAAHKILAEAAERARAENRALSELLSTIPQVANVLGPPELRDLDQPSKYLGAAEIFRRRLLETGD